uniref:Uncharacterized protein n=1 Tax=Arundo donax TaxID=35708 RepID=A0A0A8Y428_ARUDO
MLVSNLYSCSSVVSVSKVAS